MKKSVNTKVLYIKLGKKGLFEEKCLNSGLLRLDYHEVNHEWCVQQQWDKVIKYYADLKTQEGKKNVAMIVTLPPKTRPNIKLQFQI